MIDGRALYWSFARVVWWVHRVIWKGLDEAQRRRHRLQHKIADLAVIMMVATVFVLVWIDFWVQQWRSGQRLVDTIKIVSATMASRIRRRRGAVRIATPN